MALDKTAVLNATCKYGAMENAGTEVSTARVALTWTTSSTDSVVSGTESFTGAASAAVDSVGFYSALTGGTKYGTATLSGDLAFNTDGNYDLTSLTITG